MSSANATVDLDDTEGLLDADRDGLLRASAMAGAQVRATAAAIEEGALNSVADGQRPRTLVWVAGRGAAETAGTMLTASFGGSAGEPMVVAAESPPWIGPLDVLVVAGDDPGDPALVTAAATAVRRGARVVVAAPYEGPLRDATAGRTAVLAPRLSALYDKYPDLKIDLMLEERVLDLPMREADVAIRMKEPSQADLIRKRLMTIRMQLFATRSYLERHGTPTDLPGIADHRLVCQSPNSPQVNAGALLVQQLMAYNPQSLLTVNNYFGVLQGVLNDLGIGVLPDYLNEEFPDLVPVLTDIDSVDVPVFLAYPEELRQSKRISAFRDFIQDEIASHRKQLKQLGKL